MKRQIFLLTSFILFMSQNTYAESLFEEIKKVRPDTPEYRLAHIRMAIYFAETDTPDPQKLHPCEWGN